MAILKGKSRVPHGELCWFWGGNAAIRQGPWKLVWDKLVKRWELYRLDTDRTEMHDLAGENRSRVQRMAAAYNAWAERTGNRKIQSAP